MEKEVAIGGGWVLRKVVAGDSGNGRERVLVDPEGVEYGRDALMRGISEGVMVRLIDGLWEGGMSESGIEAFNEWGDGEFGVRSPGRGRGRRMNYGDYRRGQGR